MSTQSYCVGSQKNEVRLKENLKITKTVKQNKNEKDSLTFILMISCVIISMDNGSDNWDGD